MKLFLVTMNTAVTGIDNPAYSDLIGVFNSMEKAERARDAFAMKAATAITSADDCQDEYEGFQESITIDELRMNETYFDKQLEFEVY
ncbi:hypothetical protein [Secundilactobacillus muriivasis]